MPNRSRRPPTDEAATQGEWAIDLRAGTITGDAIFATLIGADPAAAATGLTLDDNLVTIHPDDKPRMVEARRKTIMRGVPLRLRYRRVVAGRERHLLALGEPERNEVGQVVGIRGTTQDVSEQVAGLDALSRIDGAEPADPLELCADRAMEARQAARAAGQPLLVYFLDMALMETGRLLAAREVEEGPEPD